MLRRFFASELVGRGETKDATRQPVPVFASAVVALTLLGFFATSVLHVDPAFAALGGALVLAGPALASGKATARDIAFALDAPFLAFVLALGLVVKAVAPRARLARRAPSRANRDIAVVATLVAAVAAMLGQRHQQPPGRAPAPPSGGGGRARGGARRAHRRQHRPQPHIRRVAGDPAVAALRQRGEELPTSEFLRLGAMTVPPVVLAATLALWVSTEIGGMMSA